MAEKGKREWGATGVGGRVEEIDPNVFKVSADASITARLSPDARTQIEQFLKDRSVEVSDPDGFFGALAGAIGLFNSGKRLREKSLPAAVRENLRRAETAALALGDALNKLDGNSCQLLDETVPDGSRSMFGHAKEIISSLKGAVLLANEYPQNKRGIKDPHRSFLAADVKDAIETYSDVQATSTKNGLFVMVLESVMKEATGIEAKALHELAKAVIKHEVKTKYPDGTIEYVPPPNPI